MFAALDACEAGQDQHYGVSVEKVEEALKAIEYPNVKTVQIIFNIFRQKPSESFFPEAKGAPRRHPGPGAVGQRAC